jgi:hypothetical protein
LAAAVRFMWSVRLAVAGRGTAVEDARLVEMEMAFHEAWRYETACRIDTLAVAGEVRPDSGDTAARDGDIHACAVGQPRVAQNEIESHDNLPFRPVSHFSASNKMRAAQWAFLNWTTPSLRDTPPI